MPKITWTMKDYNKLLRLKGQTRSEQMNNFTEEESKFFLYNADRNLKEINEKIEYLTDDMLRTAKRISGLREDKEKLESMVSKLRSSKECDEDCDCDE